MLKRIVFAITLLLSVLFLPFYLTYIIAFWGIIYFKLFWEGLIIFFISDLLYGTKVESFDYITFISTIVYLVVFIIIELSKKIWNIQEELYIKL